MREIHITPSTPLEEVKELGLFWSGRLGDHGIVSIMTDEILKEFDSDPSGFRTQSLAIGPQIVRAIIQERDIDRDRLSELIDESGGVFIERHTIWVDLEVEENGQKVMSCVDGVHKILVNASNGHWHVNAIIISLAEALDKYRVKLTIQLPSGEVIDTDDESMEFASYGRYTAPDGSMR